MTEAISSNLSEVRLALDCQEKLSIEYLSIGGESTSRTIQPLVLYFWGKTWILGAWCEMRRGFRSFRVDRMDLIINIGEKFEHTDEVSLQSYVGYQMDNEW